MTLPPQKFREILFQILYSRDFEASQKEEMDPIMMHELKVTKPLWVEAHLRWIRSWPNKKRSML